MKFVSLFSGFIDSSFIRTIRVNNLNQLHKALVFQKISLTMLFNQSYMITELLIASMLIVLLYPLSISFFQSFF
jgi:hypothetical protein